MNSVVQSSLKATQRLATSVVLDVYLAHSQRIGCVSSPHITIDIDCNDIDVRNRCVFSPATPVHL